VFGPYPPMPGPAADATLDGVRRLLAGGCDVRVISPRPSAAHDHADLRRPAGAWRFARFAAGATELVVHLDRELLTSPARRGQLPARLALAAALRSARHSVVHLPAGVEPGEGWARLVLRAADEVVSDGADGAARRSGPAAVAAPTPDADRPAWDLGPDPSREEIEAEVRRRAALHRAARRAAAGGGGPGPAAGSGRGGGDALRRLRSLPLLGPSPPTSARPLAGLAKKVVRRLTVWQVDPIIEHVNLLHRALIEAAEPRPEADGGPGGAADGH